MENNLVPAGFSLDEQTPQANPEAQATDLPQGFQLDEDKYGTGLEQLKTGLEGAASAATFGLSTGIERAFGADPRDITARREINPGAHMAGQAAGLVGSAFIPVLGEANAARVLEGAGAAGVRLAGLAGAETTAAKIGSAAVKAAVENTAFQAGDEISKMLASDPHQSVETALVNTGISGALGLGVGGVLGSVSPLWKATVGGKVGQLLDSIKSKAGGIDGTIDDSVHNAAQKLGLELTPEVKASLSNDPWVQSAAKTLEQSDVTPSGREFQGKLKEFKGKLNESILQSFGHTPETIPQEVSKYQSGKAIGDILAKEVDSKISPLAKEFEALKEKHADVDLVPDSFQEIERVDPNALVGTGMTTERVAVPGTASKLVEKISQLAEDQGWTSFNDSEIMKLVGKVQSNLPKQKSLKNLTDFISQVGKEANKDGLNFELKRAGQLMKGVLQDGESDVVLNALGKEGPELVERFTAAKSAWKDAARLVDSVDDRLKVGGSTSGFARNLKAMASTDGESVLRRLSGSGDADLLKVLQENFPETAAAVKQFHLNDLLKKASDKAAPGEILNPKALITALEKMSPELRGFAIPTEALQKSVAVSSILEQLAKAPHNFSNTARTMDKLFEYIPATAVGMTTMLAGGNPLMAGALGALTKYLSKDAPDAVKLALLKFMASGQPIESGAFKAAVDMIDHTIKGEALVNRAVKNIYQTTREVLPSRGQEVAQKDREMLDKRIREFQSHPEKMLAMGGDSAYYMPEHASALAETSGRVINYLNAARPEVVQQSPLDAPMEPSQAEKSAYNRALDLAANPLMILQDIKDGTITSRDIEAVQNMYPALYSSLSQKLTEEMMTKVSDGEVIPYKTRLSLSMFLAEPLDSTMKPEAIMATQPKPVPMPNPAQSNMGKIDKISIQAMTPGQSRVAARTAGK